MASTELAVIETGDYPVIFGGDEDLAEILRENFGGDGAALTPGDLDRISIPGAGGTTWEVPSIEGSEATKDLQGIILAWSPNRKYWEKDLNDPSNEGGAPPDCFSDDAVVGLGMFGKDSKDNPTGLCANCPMSQWGSKDGSERGPQACREGRLLYLLRPGNILPVVVSLPSTSIKPFKNYLLGLTNKQRAYWSVVTSLTLETKKDSGLAWSVVTPRAAALVDAENLDAVRDYAAMVKGIASQKRGAVVDTTATETTPEAAAEPEKKAPSKPSK